jgi:hypothetical protein
MIQRAAIDKIKRVIVEEAQTDTVGLWSVLWQVKHDVPSLAPDEARQAALTVVREALAVESVVAGEFVDQDEDTAAFMSWQVSVDEAMARIEREWTALGREPTLGEVVWFVDPRLVPLTVRKHPMGKNWKP